MSVVFLSFLLMFIDNTGTAPVVAIIQVLHVYFCREI